MLVWLSACAESVSVLNAETPSAVPATMATTQQSPSILVPTPTLENWAKVSEMPIPRFEANAVTLNGKIYVAGGITARNSLKSFESFDPATDTWAEPAPLPEFRNHHGMAVLDGKIYLSGGNFGEFSFDGLARTFWVYTPETDRWESLADMPSGRSSHGMAEIDGKLYVAGGMTTRADEATELWVYDPKTNTWDASRAHLPTARDHLVVASYKGKLYVAGGRYSTNLKKLEIYDPVTDTWTQGPDMPTARSGMGFAILSGQLHTLAGEDVDTRHIYMKHEVFDFASQLWIKLPDIPHPLNAPIAVATNGYIYIMGGGGFSGVPYKDVWRFTP